MIDKVLRLVTRSLPPFTRSIGITPTLLALPLLMISQSAVNAQSREGHPCARTVYIDRQPVVTCRLHQEATVIHDSCSCGCGGQTSCVNNPGNCHVQIVGNCGKPVVNSKPFPVEPPKDCFCKKKSIDFYEAEERRTGWIHVPVKKQTYKEVFRFKRKEFEICGCKLRICIPCAIDCIKTEKCEAERVNHELVARIRTGSSNPRRADIWVYDVKGYPSVAVVALNVTAQEATNQFGITFGY